MEIVRIGTFVVLAAAWASIWNVAAAEEFAFEVRSGKESSTLTIRTTEENGERIYTSRMSDTEQYYRYGPGNVLLEWRFSSGNSASSFTALADGSSILITGEREGSAFTVRVETGDEDWYQNSEFGLLEFVRSPAKTKDFFVIDPVTLKKTVLRARKASPETLIIDGREVPTVRLKAAPTGLASLLWNSTYWYSLPGYTFVRYEADAAPGVPRTEIVLTGVLGP